jgi:hypothetical protein
VKLSRFTRSQISSAQRGGGQLSHIPGENPRKEKLTAIIPGSTPRKHMGMSHATAPFKHQMSLFRGNTGAPTGVGMGMEGPEEGLPA